MESMKTKTRSKFLAKTIPVLLTALLFLTACQKPLTKAEKEEQAKETVTFFFHGYGSSINAEKHMANAARQAGKSNEVLEARVEENGLVKIKGKLADNPKNPIVLVGFSDNRNPDYHKDGWYAYKAVKAAHFNGIVGMEKDSPIDAAGKPKKMNSTYQELTRLRQVYPKGIDVLNIYGDTGKKSDGSVYNNSSRSLKYLLIKAKSYKEVKITGKGGQHSRLHENRQVDQVLQKFLWE